MGVGVSGVVMNSFGGCVLCNNKGEMENMTGERER